MALKTGKVTVEEALKFLEYSQVEALKTGKPTVEEALSAENEGNLSQYYFEHNEIKTTTIGETLYILDSKLY